MLNVIRRLLGRPEEHHVAQVRCFGEQLGPSETQLKLALQSLLKEHSLIKLAYLARVVYVGQDVWRVALCIYGPSDPELAASVGEVFARQFAEGVPLDI